MKKILLLACAVALTATLASATTIAPGTSGATPSVLDPFPSYTVRDVSGPTSFTGLDASNNVKFTGSFETAVITDNNTGYLTFLYQFSVNSSSPDSIVRMSSTNFAGFTTDAGYYTSAWFTLMGPGSVAPDTVDRSFNGSVVGFNFNQGVAPGTTTYLLAVVTNAHGWTTGSTQFQDGGVATVKSYAPTVPEPATMTLLASGLLMFGVKRFRK
jgi:hypothetical protein